MSDSTNKGMPVMINSEQLAGNIINHLDNWKALTSDIWILNCVTGYEIPFICQPLQTFTPTPFRMSLEETMFVNSEIEVLLSKGVLKRVHMVHDQWVSNIFLRPKSNGIFHMILDLTRLNKIIEYKHFKMFNLTILKVYLER